MSFFKWIAEKYRIWNRSPVEAYLADAPDHAVLEYRLGQIERGQAPFQRGLFNNWDY
jgi:hypothetical protein